MPLLLCGLTFPETCHISPPGPEKIKIVFSWRQFFGYPWSGENISWSLMPLGKLAHFSPAHPSFKTPALPWACLGLGCQSSVRELYFCLLSLKTPSPSSVFMCCDLGNTRVFEFYQRLKPYFVCCFVRRIFFLRDGQRKPSMFSPAPWGGCIIWPLKWILLDGVFATDLQPHLTFTKMRRLCALQMSCVTWLPWENCISSQLICCHSRKNKLHHANGVFQTRLSLKESNLLFSTFNGRLSKM